MERRGSTGQRRKWLGSQLGSQQRPQRIPQRVLNLEWSFRVVMSWGEDFSFTLPPCWQQRGRQATARARRRGAISAPETTSSVWASSQLLTKFSWDPGQLTSARRTAARDELPRGDTRNTWDGASTVHPGNQLAGTGEVIRCTTHLGRVCSPSTWLPELLGPKGTKLRPNRVCAFVEYLRTWTWVA